MDRLLASPRYGERWARHWLDVARYADSNGLDENLAFANAFRYRQQFDAACSCRKVGQSWADAMGALKDNTVERGDIVVTDEKSKALALPPKPAPARGQQAAPQAPAANAPAAANTAPAAGSPVRSVGPATNYPTR